MSLSALYVQLCLMFSLKHAKVLYLQEQAAFSSISSTGCQLTDIDCICKDQSFITSLLPIVEKDCSPADLQSTFYPITRREIC